MNLTPTSVKKKVEELRKKESNEKKVKVLLPRGVQAYCEFKGETEKNKNSK